MQKVFNAFATVSLVIGIGTVGSGIFLYKWATNPSTHEKIKTEIIKSVTKSVGIPKTTGLAVPSQGKLPF